MKSIIICIALVILLISVICIYGARGIVRNKVEIEKENQVVLGMKVVCCILAVISLFILYYFK
ncbi:MAG: hypothetical protein K0R72_728 [Clostridia bacterium]|jgi:hypothetical protein|nr:hypothetical protein [Clostridia bacterium]